MRFDVNKIQQDIWIENTKRRGVPVDQRVGEEMKS
jgi:hypothetical protein